MRLSLLKLAKMRLTMSDRTLPYYKWFWQDWRANRKIQRMSYVERGLYRELLDECWAEGYIPNDIKELADICGCPEDVMADAWQVLSSCFIEVKDGSLINEKLHSLRTEKDIERLKKSENGRKGGIAKYLKTNDNVASAKQMPSNCHIEEKRREEKSAAPKVANKGTRWSKDYPMPDAWLEYCVKARPDLNPKDTFESFTDYWVSVAGAKGVKLDWSATWRNWVRSQRASNKPMLHKNNLFAGAI